MKKTLQPWGDIIISLSEDGKTLKLNSYADEIRLLLFSEKSKSEILEFLQEKYGIEKIKADKSVSTVIDVIKNGTDGNCYEDILNSYGQLHSGVSGRSMYPLLLGGRDSVICEKLTRNPKKYDVVLYKRNGKYILHRIVKIKKAGYIIRGDNCYFDETDIEEFLGVMKGFYRKGKFHSDCEMGYKIYSRLRVFFYPLRKFFHALHIFASKLKRSVISR